MASASRLAAQAARGASLALEPGHVPEAAGSEGAHELAEVVAPPASGAPVVAIGENLDAQNLYAVLTAMSTLILIPLMLGIEGFGMFKAFKDVVKAGDFTNKSLSLLLALGGLTYYAYNEVAFLALGKVNPVTHAVGNTIKRVVIIVASVIAFKTPMSTGSIVGSSVAIAGTLLYSLAMNASKKTDKKK